MWNLVKSNSFLSADTVPRSVSDACSPVMPPSDLPSQHKHDVNACLQRVRATTTKSLTLDERPERCVEEVVDMAVNLAPTDVVLEVLGA